MATVLHTQSELRNAPHVAGLMFHCADCGQDKPVKTEGGTGYGYFGPDQPDNKPICYECCGKREATTMRETGKATLYLEHKGRDTSGWVTNWPGTLRLPCGVSIGRHNMAGKRYDVWFVFEGYQWHGVTYGDNTQICHCKRTKGKA